MTRKSYSAEACNHAKRDVEAADQYLRGKVHKAGGDAKVGEEPQGIGLKGRSDVIDQLAELSLREAVHEKVAYNEVIVGMDRWSEAERIGMDGIKSIGIGRALFPEQPEHLGTAIDRSRVQVWIGSEQLREESPIAVPKNERMTCRKNAWEKMQACPFKHPTQRQVFEHAIRPGDVVEVWRPVHRKGATRSGVSKARSAAARKSSAGIFSRSRCSRRSANVARATAA